MQLEIGAARLVLMKIKAEAAIPAVSLPASKNPTMTFT
jgi:hypothetical protein